MYFTSVYIFGMDNPPYTAPPVWWRHEGRASIPAVYFCLYVEEVGLQTGQCLEFKAH